MWADRYDVSASTVGKEQDAIIDKIFTNVGDATMLHETQRLRREPVETLTGDEIANIADYLFWKASRRRLDEAMELLKSAVEKQPDSAMAHAYLAFIHSQLPSFGLGAPEDCRKGSLKEAARALELAPADPTVLAWVALVYHFTKDNEKALTFAQQAVSLGPKTRAPGMRAASFSIRSATIMHPLRTLKPCRD